MKDKFYFVLLNSPVQGTGISPMARLFGWSDKPAPLTIQYKVFAKGVYMPFYCAHFN